MSRLKNRPVQIFTGYCDTTPYFQLKPAPATIEASCTLKRLLYTYYDPGLPFVQQVLTQRGWTADFSDGGLGLANMGTSQQLGNNPDGDQDQNDQLTDVTDGSIGALLYDVLLYIGNWDPSTIYIENIPKTVYQTAESLLGDINAVNEEAQKELRELLKYIIGTNSLGLGSPTSPNPSSADGVAVEIMNILVSRNFTENAAAGITGNAYQESTWDPSAMEPGTNNGGLFGFTAYEKSLESMKSYAESRGEPWTNVQVQVEFMLSVGWSSGLKNRLNNSSLEQATEIFMNEWEKPAAEYANLDRRIEGAKRALQLYKASGTGPPGAPGAGGGN